MTELQSSLDQLSSLPQEEMVDGGEAAIKGGPGGRERGRQAVSNTVVNS